jgi:hypothetical protein
VDQKFGPGPVDIDIAGIVEHIGGVSARRPHIHLEGNILVGRSPEELDVEKSCFHPKGLEACAADLFKLGRDIPQRIVVYVPCFVDGFHNALAETMGSEK